MSQFRRQDDRRRRVLMTAASATAARPTTGSRSRLESMREARRPTLVYGTRVRQGLRGRWFSLVPVERSALAKLLAAVSAVVLVIVLMNDATVRFRSIESQPAFVNVFQVIRPGSLGRYAIGVMYLILAGAAWMVYQLRRFRNDDFRGNYRLWQWIVGVSLVASIATVVPLLAMFGAAVELLMGRRIALSGHDWIGLFLVVGGAILALRTIAEMWQYRPSLSMSIGGWFCAAIPVASQWNIMAVDTNLRWSVVTAAPLLAVSLWFAATVTYLRSLYREVRGMERSAGFLQRLQDIASRPFTRARSSDTAKNSMAEDEPTPLRKTAAAKANRSARTEEAAADSELDRTKKPATPRRWFGLLPPAKPRVEKPKPEALGTTKPSPEKTRTGSTQGSAATVSDVADDDDSQNQPNDEDSVEQSTIPAEAKPKRRWWPNLRSGSKANADAVTADDEGEEESAVEEAVAQPKKRRFGLGAVMKRNRNSQSDDAGPDEEDSQTRSPSRSESSSAAKISPTADSPADDADEDDDSDEDGYADDDIDWSSMNKAERRRMRKQLKRGGKAA